jgi:hypothetical protein
MSTLFNAVALLSDLKASFEHPGYISIVKDGVTYNFGDANGDFGYDYEWSLPPNLSGSGWGDETLPADSTAEQLADWIRKMVNLKPADL